LASSSSLVNQSSASKNERRPKAPDCKNATPPSEPDISASQTDPSDRTKQASYRLSGPSVRLQHYTKLAD